MHKLIEKVDKELRDIEEKGINMNNLEVLSKLVDIRKDLAEIQKDGGEESYMRGGYGREDYGRGYMMDDYGRGSNYRGDYGRGNSNSGNYRGSDPRMRDHMNRILDSAEEYDYGRERYRASGNEERMHDGLEKLMYAICMFVESTMEFAESPQEKEIIRKHIQKLKNV